MKIYGLEKYSIDKTDLQKSYSTVDFKVKILIRFFNDLVFLRTLSPKERRLLIQQKLRDDFKILINDYPKKDYELIGTRIKPYGLIGNLSGKQILILENELVIDRIIVLESENLELNNENKEELYFSVQGLFAIKIEGYDYTNSIRFIEERIILVKAKDSDEAIHKAKIDFKKYADFEYLNCDYRLTKWEFIEIIDIFETDVSEIDSEGTEIFSITKNRKIKKCSNTQYSQ